jgi:hypothetical protein
MVLPLTPENKQGMIGLHRLLAQPGLRERDREFINSIMRQCLARPISFSLTERQIRWLKDILIRVNWQP